ncbi:Uncharacterised protein [Oligella ureolytica]|uniref:ParG n=1 Tax=Oligella ureolytica TaxID=90244 RepID=A0A379B086_9BURK|nr:hypothetical protein [Oligella ureolytica]QPT38931.1 hypothetical protein I6G29_00160 [Oligella ureolytica]SUB29823.1 Uncharacterised protein [Oligella ureolytica]
MLSAYPSINEPVQHDSSGSTTVVEGPKRVNFQISAELHRKLKIYAANEGKTITEVLTDYVEQLPDNKEIER